MCIHARVHAHTHLCKYIFKDFKEWKNNPAVKANRFLIGGTWLSRFASLIFIVLFGAGLQGVKYKLEQMA